MTVNIANTPLRQVFRNTGQGSVDESAAEVLTKIENGQSARWHLSVLDSRPIKWAIVNRENDQAYLCFAKEQINDEQQVISPSVLFDIDELSQLTDISLANKECRAALSEYKGKILGPLDDSEATALLTMICLKNYAAELQQDAKTIAQGLKL